MSVSKNVPMEVYETLQARLDVLQKENDKLKQKSPILGIRWFGDGGFGVKLSNPILGQEHVALEGFNSSAVIDKAAWQKIKAGNHGKIGNYVTTGLLCRDDSVVEEQGMVEMLAEPDPPGNPNAFTNAEVKKLLEGPVDVLRKVIAKTTAYWVPGRFLRMAKELGGISDTKKLLLRDKKNSLFDRYQLSYLHIYDLRDACTRRNIPSDGLEREQMINAILKHDSKKQTVD